MFADVSKVLHFASMIGLHVSLHAGLSKLIIFCESSFFASKSHVVWHAWSMFSCIDLSILCAGDVRDDVIILFLLSGFVFVFFSSFDESVFVFCCAFGLVHCLVVLFHSQFFDSQIYEDMLEYASHGVSTGVSPGFLPPPFDEFGVPLFPLAPFPPEQPVLSFHV